MKNIFEQLKIRQRLQIIFVAIAFVYAANLAYSLYNINLMRNEINDIYNNQLVGINNLVEAKSSMYKSAMLISQSLNATATYEFATQSDRARTILENTEDVDIHFAVFRRIFENDEAKYFTQIETFKYNYKIIYRLSKLVELHIRNNEYEEVSDIYFGEYYTAFSTAQETLDQLTVMSQNEAQLRYNDSIAIVQKIKLYSILFIAIVIVLLLGSGYLFANSLMTPLMEVEAAINRLRMGDLSDFAETRELNKIDAIKSQLGQLADGLRKAANFAKNIKTGNLNTQFTPISDSDTLGHALLDLQAGLKAKEEADQKRREAEETQNWIAQGLAQFNDLLRMHNTNQRQLADVVIGDLVQKIRAVQGGIFMVPLDSKKELELISAYAFSRKKFVNRRVKFGEGLLGACALEKATIVVDRLPDDYISISSGFGEGQPSMLLLVPMLVENSLFGIIEIATINDFKPHEVVFVEKLAKAIASTLSVAHMSEKANELEKELAERQMLLDEQNYTITHYENEVQTVREDLELREKELSSLNSAISEKMLWLEIDASGVIEHANHQFVGLLNLIEHDIKGAKLRYFVKKMHGYEGFDAFMQQLLVETKIRLVVELSTQGKSYNVDCMFVAMPGRYQAISRIVMFGVQV